MNYLIHELARVIMVDVVGLRDEFMKKVVNFEDELMVIGLEDDLMRN